MNYDQKSCVRDDNMQTYIYIYLFHIHICTFKNMYIYMTLSCIYINKCVHIKSLPSDPTRRGVPGLATSGAELKKD